MNIEVITQPFDLTIYGIEGIAYNKDYVKTAFALSGKMWDVVKSNGLENKGKNIWMYDSEDRVFAGVELEKYSGSQVSGLQEKRIHLEKYAYYKHVGAYSLIREVGQKMTAYLTTRGLEVVLPYIEIYGHWSNDETKLETELLMCLK